MFDGKNWRTLTRSSAKLDSDWPSKESDVVNTLPASHLSSVRVMSARQYNYFGVDTFPNTLFAH
jgi:hypothetical protein